ncbi:MAG: hypothetical protein KDH96_09770, partial [Candidatus Riesia sp.]|nr:hypothetical protein [Candidatus Riesia sp.]
MKNAIILLVVTMLFLCENAISVGSSDRTVRLENITTDKTNQDINVTPTGTGVVSLNNYALLNDVLLYNFEDDSVSTGANVTLDTPEKTVKSVSNVSLSSIDMITAPSLGDQFFILTNKTGAVVTVNNLTGATPANQIITGTGDNLDMAINASLSLYYDTNSSKWRVVGGSGGGAGTLQEIYDASVPPSIDVTDTNGPLVLADSNLDPMTDNILEIQDSSDVETFSFDI